MPEVIVRFRPTLPGVRVQVRPVLGDAEDAKVTILVKPLTPETVIVELAGALARAVTDVGLAVTVKSCIVTLTVAEWDSVPLVPVTVTV